MEVIPDGPDGCDSRPHRSNSKSTVGTGNSSQSAARLRVLRQVVAQKNRASTNVKEIVLGNSNDSYFGAIGEFNIWLQGIRDDLETRLHKDIENNRLRRFAYLLSNSSSFQTLVGLIIIGHMFIGVFDTNLAAQGKRLPPWASFMEVCIVLVYLVELFFRICAERLAFILDRWSLFECFLVACDLIMLVSAPGYGGISLLRGIRLLRVFRLLRKFLVFREVYLMVMGVGTAFRTLGFGALIAFLIMTSLAVLAVETLNPLSLELEERGAWGDCEWCHRAFDSVMAANLTFVRTILAGDSWGVLCVPLIENYMEAAVLLPLIFVIIQLGVVNIIIAVLVDRIQESRMDDEALRKAVKEESLRKSYRQLLKVFKSIDTSGDGEISIEELMDAYDTNYVFKNLMNMMDFTSENMSVFFDILDKDHSGAVNYEEFVAQLHFMRVFDSHTMLVMIHHLIECLQDEVHDGFNRESVDALKDFTKPDSPWGNSTTSEDNAESSFNDTHVTGIQRVYNTGSELPEDVRCEPFHPSIDMVATKLSQLQDLAPWYEEMTPGASPYDWPPTAMMESCINMRENVKMYDKMLEFIDVLEADMSRLIETVESVVQESTSALVLSSPPSVGVEDFTKAPFDTKYGKEQFKQRLKDEISQLRQIKNHVQSCISSLLSWYHLREEAPMTPKP